MSPSSLETVFLYFALLLVIVFILIGIILSKVYRSTDLYGVIEPYAKNVKIVLQMFVGIGATLLLLVKLLNDLEFSYITQSFPDLTRLVSKLPTLNILGFALIYSTGIDLAYMLFTDGPDEAVKPINNWYSRCYFDWNFRYQKL